MVIVCEIQVLSGVKWEVFSLSRKYEFYSFGRLEKVSKVSYFVDLWCLDNALARQLHYLSQRHEEYHVLKELSSLLIFYTSI